MINNKSYFLLIVLLYTSSLFAQKKIGLLCTNFKINNEIREDGAVYRKSLESVLSNLKNPPIIIDRDNLSDLLIKIQEEANLNADFQQSIPILKAANIDYVVYANIEKRVVENFYNLQIEFVKISGENTFSKKMFPILIFTENELRNTYKFREKLNELLNTYAFTVEFGIIENEQLQKIYNRLDEKDAEIQTLRTGLENLKNDANNKSKTINSLSNVISEIQLQNSQKEKEIKRLNNEVNGIKDYSSIAELDQLGFKIRYSYPLTGGGTELSNLIGKVIFEKEGQIKFRFSDSALVVLETVINKYPNFPFSYWAKSMILLKKGDSNWLNNAQKALEIFKVTTSIEGHKKSHDQGLKFVLELLEIKSRGSDPILSDVYFIY